MDIYSEGLPQEDIAFFHSLVLHGIKLNLENVYSILTQLNNPHRNYLSIHVGGTNGKGSTVAVIERILREAGYTVGKFTSPHLIDLSERFQINGEPITAEELHQVITDVRHVIESKEIVPTFFEFCTAIAFYWFSERKVDWAVIEVGMGGRLDSTNVIIPVVSAITNVRLEHTQFLGDTLEKIAWEKAGIIKSQVPIVTAEQHPGPFGVIQNRAKELRAPLWQINRDFTVQKSINSNSELQLHYQSQSHHWKNIPFGMKGSCQVENAGVALAVVDLLCNSGHAISEDAIHSGCRLVRWPGRFDLISTDPWILIDCAHNPAGMERLVENLPDAVIVLLSVADDKDIRSILRTLSEKAEMFIFTQFYGKRALSVDSMILSARETVSVPYVVEPDLHSALEFALEQARLGKKLVITGSIYTVGQTYQWLIKKGIMNKITF